MLGLKLNNVSKRGHRKHNVHFIIDSPIKPALPTIISYFKASLLSVAFMHHRTEPSLVQIMACHWFGISHNLNQCWLLIKHNLSNRLPWKLMKPINSLTLLIQIDSLWPCDTIWWHRSGSTLAHVPDGTSSLLEPMLKFHQRCSVSYSSKINLTKCAQEMNALHVFWE